MDTETQIVNDPTLTLRKVSRENEIPATTGQLGIWYVCQKEELEFSYNEQVDLRIEGVMSVKHLETCFTWLVKRHESLRTVFTLNRSGELIQKIKNPFPVHAHEITISDKNASDIQIEDEITQAGLQSGAGAYQLDQLPLFRLCLLNLPNNRQVLLWSAHHIILDATAFLNLLDDWKIIDQALNQGIDPPPLSTSVQMADYAVWEKNYLHSNECDGAVYYWREKLNNMPPLLNLPYDRVWHPEVAALGAWEPVGLSQPLIENLTRTGRKSGVSINVVLLAALHVLMMKYTGQRDVIIGSPRANRNLREQKKIVGHFSNIAILRADLTAQKLFTQLLREVKTVAREASSLFPLPHHKILEIVRASGWSVQSPLFQVGLEYRPNGFKPVHFADSALSQATYNSMGDSKCEIMLSLKKHGDILEGHVEYNTELFNRDTVQRFFQHFKTLLYSILNTPDSTLSSLEYLTAEEKNTVLYQWNDTNESFTPDVLTHHLLEKNAKLFSDSIAVVDAQSQITYECLNQRSNQLAHYLIKNGIVPESRVALCFMRSFDLMIAMFATLKAGASYIPIDPAYPQQRIEYILKDANAGVLLSEKPVTNSQQMLSHSKNIILNDLWPQLKNNSLINPRVCVLPQNAVYVIYTSGSTGKPKGVLVSHINLLRLCHWHKNKFTVSSYSKATQLAGVGFDAMAWEVWPALSMGAQLHLLPQNLNLMPEAFVQWIERHKITHCFVPTPLTETLINQSWPEDCELQFLFTGGDRLNQQGNHRIPFKLLNNYGPTEVTVVTTSMEVDLKDSSAPAIGKPIGNTSVYIVDNEIHPVPVGVQGEICIGKTGVARGYIGRADLTAEKFIPDPFSKIPGQRMYRSGDLARYFSSGDIDFLGRLDHQVKIRGFRIELGEIESQIMSSQLVLDVLVVIDEQSAQKQLVAYIIPDKSKIKKEQNFHADIKKTIEQDLPDYMVPSAFVVLDQFPLTANGKVDRDALPIPSVEAFIHNDYVLPENETENQLVQIWKQLLGIEQVGTQDNFFELGGSSLKLMELKELIKKNIGADVSIAELFTYTSVAALSAHLNKSSTVVEDARQMIKKRNPVKNAKFAIIGMAGRFPSANNTEELWQLLSEGKEGLTEFTEEELRAANISEELLNNPNYIKKNGFYEHKNLFDAPLFSYTPREASLLDPQFSVFHECVWEALEHAGYGNSIETNSIGLYAGAGDNEAWASHISNSGGSFAETMGSHTMTGTNFLCTRIAHKLNLKGPAVALQTACSTSLVAIHLACQALKAGECDIALAGGSSISPKGKSGYLYQEGMIASVDGYCRPFDTNASGTLAGDGAGVLVLKILEHAQEDGDNILAIISGSAINNDGNQKVGFTAPSVTGQVSAIVAAHDCAGVSPQSISYIETHGTGTRLGDPIEIQALTEAFNCEEKGFCRIGSLKSNLGHLDSAAGVAGMIKVILAMQHKKLPESLHFTSANKHINFENSPFVVNTELSDWTSEEGPLRAGISSFGIGGTNAHVILEDSVATSESSESRRAQLVCLSANSTSALDTITDNLHQYMTNHPSVSLPDLSYTLHVGRKPLPYRKSFLVNSISELSDALKQKGESPAFSGDAAADKNRICFMFPGQGTQYFNMAKNLYEKERVFRESMDHCFLIADALSKTPFKAVLYPDSNSKTVQSDINQTAVTQPVLFMLEYSLATLLISWGIKPDSMIGHSVGEYVAACLSGVFSLVDAIHLIIQRGELIQSLPPGSMVSVLGNEQAVKQWLAGEPSPDQLCLAAVNTPGRVVVSGDKESIQHFTQTLTQKNIQHVLLHTSHAFHSHLMEPVLEKFKTIVNTVDRFAPKIPFVSNVTGEFITSAQATSADYWAKHLRQAVLFEAGVKTVCSQGKNTFIEVGPGRVLSTFLLQNPASAEQGECISLIRDAKNSHDSTASDQAYLLRGMCQLFCTGHSLNWDEFYSDEKRKRIALPTYPFEGIAYWDPADINESSKAKVSHSAEKKSNLSDWFYESAWKPFFRTSSQRHNKAQSAWVVFEDNEGIGSQLSEGIKAKGDTVIRVLQGSSWSNNDDIYRLDPADQTSYISLSDVISNLKEPHINIIHMWNVYPGSTKPSVMRRFSQSQKTGFNSVIHAVRAFQSSLENKTGHLCLITNATQQITVYEKNSPEKMGLYGLNSVMPQEYNNISSRIVDIELPIDSGSYEKTVVTDLLKELAETAYPSVTAMRQGLFWEQTFDPMHIPQRNHSTPLRSSGAYLITGGLGKIGMTLAEHLSEKYRANLVLSARTDFPGRGQWDEILKTQPDSDQAEKIKKIRTMENSGANVKIFCADVCSKREMQSIFNWMDENYGGIDGVLHTAADIQLNPITSMNVSDIEKYFYPELKGTQIIKGLIDRKSNTFCMLFSSVSSVLGGLGYAQYAASNHYLNSFAQKMAIEGKSNWISVNWDAWNFHNTDNSTDGSGVENYSFSPDEGMAIFERSLALLNIRSQLIVSTGDIYFRYQKYINEKVKTLTPEKNGKAAHSRPKMATEFVEPQTELELNIASLWKEVLGLDRVGLDDDFIMLGGDSLLTVSLADKVGRQLNKQIPVTHFLQNRTIRKQVELLQHKQTDHSDLISIQPNGDQCPIFMIPGLGGHSYVFSELATLMGENHPIFGFNTPGLDGKTTPHNDIKQAAQYYAQLIQKKQPNSRCIIMGYSLGASIAFETTQQLQANGTDIPLLILIDGASEISGMGKLSDDELNAKVVSSIAQLFFHNIDITEEQLTPLDETQQIALLNSRLQALGFISLGNIDWGGMVTVMKAQLTMSYTPSKNTVNRIVAIQAKDSNIMCEKHWKNLSNEPLQYHTINGDHTGILRSPQVKTLATIINDNIKNNTPTANLI